MFNVITIGTKNYVPLTQRLLASLHNSENDFHLSVFCDDAEAFASLGRNHRCTVRELPEIRSLGVKRARFVAYSEAFQESSFLYLDSDVIVLKPIAELVEHSRVTGCYDDLSCVSIIPDKRHPWPGDPALENRWFINSGVFFAPRGRRDFFEELLARSRTEELWGRYGRPLYDNSFLCAYFNLLDEMVDYVDSTVYNWQGFVVAGELQVERWGNSLRNRRTGKILKIAHFAGVPSPDAAMYKWPVEVTSLLSAYGSFHKSGRERSFVDFLGTLNPDFGDALPDTTPQKILNAVVREAAELTSTQLRRDYSDRSTYFVDREKMISLAYAKPPSGNRWNGLACGGDCLDGEEYNFLLRSIRDLKIKTAIHIGAQETAKLLSDFEITSLSLETEQQSWPDGGSVRCALVTCDQQTGEFDTPALQRALAVSPIESVDLLLIDPPPEGFNYSSALRQITSIAHPTYVALHDAHRHSNTIFDYQQSLGFRLLAYLPSDRGLVLLRSPSNGSGLRTGSLQPFDPEVKVFSPRVRFELAGNRATLLPEGRRRIHVTVTNVGEETLSSRYTCPVMLSYHWMSGDRQMRLFDGERSILPFDILPGCSATMEATIGAPPDSSCSVACLTLVQESVCWFDDRDLANRSYVSLEGEDVFAAEWFGREIAS